MIRVPLTIRPTQQPVRETLAWLIPGNDPGEWLAELVAWQVPLVDVLLYVVPVSRADLHPRGVLAIPDPKTGCEPRVSPRCQPYGSVAGRLYVPVHARFEPAVSEAELRGMLGEKPCLMHPAVGMVSFESDDVLRPADLLQVPALDDDAWHYAQAGVAVNQRLLSITPLAPASFEEIMAAGQDDIGTQQLESESLPSDLNETSESHPPDPSEPSESHTPGPSEPSESFAARARRRVKRALARAASWFAQKASSSAKEPGGSDSPADQSAPDVRKTDKSLDQQRERAISRLMQLLEDDPDEGLRYAIGIGSDAHRGVAPPSSQLVRHDVDFAMRKPHGRGPADFWHIEYHKQLQLATRYRELAERELRLGRHRRAAYIYAELLGELLLAASALRQGGYWREAATLYRDKLRQPREAAACLEQGGLFSEAIELYEELGEFEKAGDLYAALEQNENAEGAYRKAVMNHANADDILKAADLLETKLDSPDEAVQMLDSAWPNSSQAEACLSRYFALLGKLGRHDDAREKIHHVHHVRPWSFRNVVLAEILAHTSGNYPDRNVRTKAADTVRLIASEQLPQASVADAERFLQAVRRLVPQDRLLGRDCERVASREKSQDKLPVPIQITRDKCPGLVHEFTLPSVVNWQWAVSLGEVFYAVGYRDMDVTVVRGNWDGAYQSRTKRLGVSLHARKGLILAGPRLVDPLTVYIKGAGQPLLARFPASDQFPVPLVTGLPEWFPDDVLGATRTADSVTWVLHKGHSPACPLLSAFDRGGQVIFSRQLLESHADRFGEILWSDHFIPVPMVVCKNRVYLAAGSRLKTVHHDGRIESRELSAHIHSLAVSAPFSRMRLAATFANGGMILWDERDGDHFQPFAADLHKPLAAFTTGGLLVAASGADSMIYSTKRRRLELVTSQSGLSGTPFAVLATSQTNQFARFTTDGEVSVHRVLSGGL